MSTDCICDAMTKIGKAEIGFAVLKYFNATAALMMTESANDFWKLWDSGLFQRELARPLYVYLSTWTQEEIAYEEKILSEIIKEEGGEPVDESIQKMYEDNMDFFIIVSFLQRVLRLGGGWAPTKLSADSVSHMFEVGKAIPEFIKEFTETGKILNAPDNFQIIPMEYGHLAYIELLFLWDRNQPESLNNVMDFMRRSSETDIKHGFHSWAGQIKEKFDPNYVSNPTP